MGMYPGTVCFQVYTIRTILHYYIHTTLYFKTKSRRCSSSVVPPVYAWLVFGATASGVRRRMQGRGCPRQTWPIWCCACAMHLCTCRPCEFSENSKRKRSAVEVPVAVVHACAAHPIEENPYRVLFRPSCAMFDARPHAGCCFCHAIGHLCTAHHRT
jgi:hypothetical protein